MPYYRDSIYSLSLDGKPFCPFKDVVFTKEKFSLKQFWELHQDKLPVILKVEEGYYGGLEFDVYSSGDVLWVVKSSCQKRVVAKDLLREQYLSIPMDYDLQLRLLDQDGEPEGEPKQIHEIIKENKLPLTVDVVKKKTQLKYFVQADRDYVMDFQTLRLVETYDERYLLAHTLLTGELSVCKACVIPMYLPIAVLMAVGAKRGDHTEWDKLNNRMKAGPKESIYANHPMNTDLMIFNEEDVMSSDGLYDYIEPRHFVKFDISKGTMPSLPTKSRTPLLYPAPGARKTSLQNKRPPPPTPLEKKQSRKPDDEEVHKKKTSKEQVTAVISPIFKAMKSKFNKAKGDTTTSKSGTVTMLSSSDEEDYEEVNELPEKAKKILSIAQTHSSKERSSNLQTQRSTEAPSSCQTSTASASDKPPVKRKPKLLKSISTTSDTRSDDIYQTLQAVPKDISKLSVTEVGDCLKMLNMEEYVEKFEKEKIDGVLLKELDVDDLQEAFGMSRMMAKKLCLFGKQQWRPEK